MAAQVGLLAHHRCLVAQAQRQVAIGKARRDHTGNRKRDVGTHDQQLVIIEKLEGSVVQRRAALEHVAVLHERRLDREVAVLGKAHLHRLRDALALQRFPGQDVSESSRSPLRHNLPSHAPALQATVCLAYLSSGSVPLISCIGTLAR